MGCGPAVRRAAEPRFSSRLSRVAMMLRWVYLLFRAYVFLVRPITLGVRVMLIRNREVLLVRHTYMPGWFLPGGGLKRGETFDAAARREVAEEVGAELHDISLVGAYSTFRKWRNDHTIVFLSTKFDLSGEHDHEIAELRFFALDGLPEDVDPAQRKRLEEYRAGRPSPQFGEW
jgi:ADP-ribose pyrophosphatase YjhB (NUDIX family)